ncbi:MAG: DoxX family protein [Micromonosporaceae bacterium]
MDTTVEQTTTAPGKAALITGWVITGLVIAFLLFDSTIHILNIEMVQTATADLGFPPWTAPVMGWLLLVGIVLHLVPRTALLGAIWLSAYLGGALAAQLRLEAPLFSTLLFSVYVGGLLWLGFYIRDAGVRRILPLRQD